MVIAMLMLGDVLAYTECSNTTRSGRYQQEHRLEEFVFLFDTSGENALPDQTDRDENDVPDVIDDVAMQLVTMRDVLSLLGFRHPFSQYRYKRVNVDRIYVAMKNLQRNGTAFDPSHRDLSRPGRKPCVLLMHLSIDLTTGNLTPAHELFHLYQYGYTVFKNSWYLEGMARWAEGLMRPASFPESDFPQTSEERNNLFSQSYEAAAFWQDLITSIPSRLDGTPDYPEEVTERRYVGGKRIIHPEAMLRGTSTAIEILEVLDRLDRKLSMEKERPIKSWSRNQRTDPKNNEIMLRALARMRQRAGLPTEHE